jgi:hypothetical protein
LAGQEDNGRGIAEVVLESNAENLIEVLEVAGATDLTPPEAEAEIAIPSTSAPFSLESLQQQTEQQQLIDFFGFDPNNPSNGDQ